MCPLRGRDGGEKRVPASCQALHGGGIVAPTFQHPIDFRLGENTVGGMSTKPEQDFGLGVGALLANLALQLQPLFLSFQHRPYDAHRFILCRRSTEPCKPTVRLLLALQHKDFLDQIDQYADGRSFDNTLAPFPELFGR